MPDEDDDDGDTRAHLGDTSIMSSMVSYDKKEKVS